MSLNKVTINNFPNINQQYRTENVSNTHPAIYALNLRYGTPPYKSVVGSVIFPISPQDLRKSRVFMSSFYDVSGNGLSGGVHRIVDQYGVAPPIFVLEGTTGWQKHSNDNFANTGLEAAKFLQQYLDYFAIFNTIKSQNNRPDLFILEYYDYFTDDFWEVAPIGEQIMRQSESQPLLFHYRLRLVGMRELKIAPPAPTKVDLISQAFSTAASTVGRTVQAFSNMVTGTYQEIAGIV